MFGGKAIWTRLLLDSVANLVSPASVRSSPDASRPGGASVDITGWLKLNSEVLLPGSVAVAETNRPGDTAAEKLATKLAAPVASVVTVMKPKNVCPCPTP